MKIDPKTEKELQEAMNFPAGTYDFEVIQADDKISKSGNEMIALKLRVFTEDGSPRFVNDYLLESSGVKLRHFFECIGRIEAYNSGDAKAIDCEAGAGKVKIKIGKANGIYAAKNEVADYIVPKEGEEVAPRKTQKEAVADTFEDEEIPF